MASNQPARPGPDGSAHSTRRTLLRGALAAGPIGIVLASAGCQLADPAIRRTATDPPRPTPTPSPSPTPPSGTEVALDAELAAEAWCLALTAEKYRLPKEQRANLMLAASVHRRHVNALLDVTPQARPDPTRSPTPPTPTLATPVPTGPRVKVDPDPDPGKALTQLSGLLNGIASEYRPQVAAAATGTTALLWASLAAAAAQSEVLARRTGASAPLPDEPDHPPHRPAEVVPAAQDLLAQLHAMIHGYEVALAPLAGQSAVPYAERLLRLRSQRDHLARLLHEREVDVPAAEPEYDTGPRVSTTAAAIALVSRMEWSLLPFIGQWVAASVPEIGLADDRIEATRWLIDATRSGLRAGAAPQWWPGWPDG